MAPRPKTADKPPPQKLLTPAEVADILRKSEDTLTYWRYRKEGPPYVRVGKSVGYRPESLAEWLESKEQQTT